MTARKPLRVQARDLSRKLTAARDAQSAIDAFQDAVEAGLDQPVALSPRSLLTIQSRLEALRAAGRALDLERRAAA